MSNYSFQFRYDALPKTREAFKANELPLCQRDIRHIARELGAEVAANAEVITQLIRQDGGVNPNTVRTVFPGPEGTAGNFDQEALVGVLSNYMVWREYDPLS